MWFTQKVSEKGSLGIRKNGDWVVEKPMIENGKKKILESRNLNLGDNFLHWVVLRHLCITYPYQTFSYLSYPIHT
jgi:hypothetical protein